MDYDFHEAMKLGNQLCFPLYAASRNVINLYTPYLKPLGLTYTQYITLLALWEKDGVTVGELCGKLMLDNGTLSPLLIRRRDLISRTASFAKSSSDMLQSSSPSLQKYSRPTQTVCFRSFTRYGDQLL